MLIFICNETVKMNRSRNRHNSFVVGKNAERERNRVRCLRAAFQTLQGRLPTVPPNTKLSKLDILILATNYINQLTKLLQGANIQESALNQHLQNKFFHPIKKWPMRKRLYSRINNDNNNRNNDGDIEEEEEEEEEEEDGEYNHKQQDDLTQDSHQQQYQQIQIETDTKNLPYEQTVQQFDNSFAVPEYSSVPEKYNSHIDFIWFQTYETDM